MKVEEMDELNFRQVSLVEFAFKFGLKNVRREVFRIAGRLFLERKKNLILMAFDNLGGVLGYGVARPCPSKYLFATKNDCIIGPIYVVEHYRGRGLGTKLLLEMEILQPEILQRRANKMYSYVLVHNIGSCKSFEKAGFKKIGCMVEKEKGFFDLAEQGNFYVYSKGVSYEESNYSWRF